MLRRNACMRAPALWCCAVSRVCVHLLATCAMRASHSPGHTRATGHIRVPSNVIDAQTQTEVSPQHQRVPRKYGQARAKMTSEKRSETRQEIRAGETDPGRTKDNRRDDWRAKTRHDILIMVAIASNKTDERVLRAIEGALSNRDSLCSVGRSARGTDWTR